MARILVVDDSPTQLLAHTKMLKRNGHEVIAAEDGESAVALADSSHPDLILMDVVMPKLNGFQATRKISSNHKTAHIPILMVTTKDQETDVVWGTRQGAKEYLVKPINEQDLIDKVARYLSH